MAYFRFNANTAAPAVPAITALQSLDTVLVTWSECPGASMYQVKFVWGVDDEDIFVVSAHDGASSYLYTGLTEGQEFTVAVAAVGANGVVSEYCDAESVTTEYTHIEAVTVALPDTLEADGETAIIVPTPQIAADAPYTLETFVASLAGNVTVNSGESATTADILGFGVSLAPKAGYVFDVDTYAAITLDFVSEQWAETDASRLVIDGNLFVGISYTAPVQ